MGLSLCPPNVKEMNRIVHVGFELACWIARDEAGSWQLGSSGNTEKSQNYM